MDSLKPEEINDRMNDMNDLLQRLDCTVAPNEDELDEDFLDIIADIEALDSADKEPSKLPDVPTDIVQTEKSSKEKVTSKRVAELE